MIFNLGECLAEGNQIVNTVIIWGINRTLSCYRFEDTKSKSAYQLSQRWFGTETPKPSVVMNAERIGSKVETKSRRRIKSDWDMSVKLSVPLPLPILRIPHSPTPRRMLIAFLRVMLKYLAQGIINRLERFHNVLK